MRLFGITALALLLAALVTLVINQRDTILDLARGPSDRDIHILNSTALPEHGPATGAVELATFPMREGGTWIALSALPSFAKAEFDLPRDAIFDQATLVLEFSAHLEADASAQLRININGLKRGEVLIEEGRSTHRARFDLRPNDLIRDRLSVSLSINGRSKQIACTREWAGGLVVQIEPTSHVEVPLETPLESLEDRLRASGAPNRVIWPDTQDATSRAGILAFAWARNRVGDPVTIEHAPHASADAVALPAEALVDAFKHFETQPKSWATWPVSLLEDAEQGTRRFEYETGWKLDFALSDMPGRAAPAMVELDLQLNSLGEAQSWLLNVTLNDRLLLSETLPQGRRHLTRKIRLPAPWQMARNQLEITLTSGEKQDGPCARGIPAIAHLAAATLRPGDAPMPLSFGLLPAAFQSDIELRAPTYLSTLEANAALSLMIHAVEDAQFHDHPVPSGARIEVLRGKALENLNLSEDRLYWLLIPDTDARKGAPEYQLIPASSDTAKHIARHQPPRAALLLSRPRPEQYYE